MTPVFRTVVLFLGSVVLTAPVALAGPPDFSACDGRTGQALGICKAWIASGCSVDSSGPQCEAISDINPGEPLPLGCPCWTSPDLDVFVDGDHVYGYSTSQTWDSLWLNWPGTPGFFHVGTTLAGSAATCQYDSNDMDVDADITFEQYLDCRDQILEFTVANGLDSCTYGQWAYTPPSASCY